MIKISARAHYLQKKASCGARELVEGREKEDEHQWIFLVARRRRIVLP